MLNDIKSRADKAAQLMRTQKLSASGAARRVIQGEGIRYEPDVKRLVTDITSELGKRGALAKAARKRNQVTTPSLYRRPVQEELKLD